MTNKKIMVGILLFIIGGLFYMIFLTPHPRMFKKLEVDFIVCDDQGVPVKNAKIDVTHRRKIFGSKLRILFSIASFFYPKGIYTTSTYYTDKNGICKLRLRTDTTRLLFHVTKKGWYDTTIELPERLVPGQFTQWTREPRKTPIMFKQIKKPTSLICGSLKKYPSLTDDETFALYDMFHKDWLPPYGEGIYPDIRVSLHGGLKIEFLGEGNGIQEIPDNMIAKGSQFLFPYEALLENYNDKYVTPKPIHTVVLTNAHDYYDEYFLEGNPEITTTNCFQDEYYMFRIRTRYTPDGDIAEAFYGYLIGEKKLKLESQYYLNPTPNDRNLEPARTGWNP